MDIPEVSHPAHYNQGKVECLDAIESALGPIGFRSFLAGNVIKYIWRYQYKNGLEDLEKAYFYLGKLIDTIKESEKN